MSIKSTLNCPHIPIGKDLLGQGGLIGEIVEGPRSNGTQKTTGVIWGFYATCVDVYWITWKRAVLKPNLT